MDAKIMMVIDGCEYEYGIYPFDTTEQKNKVNEIAIRVRQERNCDTYIKEVGV